MTYHIIKQQAIELRKQGYSYNLISEKLGIAKSTLNGWLPGVPYKPNSEVIARIGLNHARAGESMSAKKRASIEKADALGKKDVGKITKRDLFMLGIGVYIGEGSKFGSFIRVINAEPALIVLAIRWFTEVCAVPFENLSIRLHLYPDNDIQTCIHYWSQKTGLGFHQFSKCSIDTREGKKMGKRGKLPYGTAHLSVKSMGNILHGAFLRRRIDAWMNAVLQRD